MTRHIFTKLKLLCQKLSTTQSTQLGRWNLKHDCHNKETRVVFWANSDHCGDTLCGNVIKSKKLLENKLQTKDLQDK